MWIFQKLTQFERKIAQAVLVMLAVFLHLWKMSPLTHARQNRVPSLVHELFRRVQQRNIAIIMNAGPVFIVRFSIVIIVISVSKVTSF